MKVSFPVKNIKLYKGRKIAATSATGRIEAGKGSLLHCVLTLDARFEAVPTHDIRITADASTASVTIYSAKVIKSKSISGAEWIVQIHSASPPVSTSVTEEEE